MRFIIVLLTAFAATVAVSAQRVTVHAADLPAAQVFDLLMQQTGKNFVYQSSLLDGVRVNVSATRRPLAEVLNQMFRGTDIKFKIKGNDVMLMRTDQRRDPKSVPSATTVSVAKVPDKNTANVLEEVVVTSSLNDPEVQTPVMGARKVTADDIRNSPAIFGESDIMKTLQYQPGVTAGVDGSATMHVHGGASDENLFLLDNVPVYHVNHLGGLFSAFNTDMVRYVDFYKSSIPARYDGRLSSVMDVRTRTGIPEHFSGSARLGTVSGSVNLNGPIGENTAYSVALRRSWLDLITTPIFKYGISDSESDVRFGYFLHDINAKIIHRFGPKTSAFASVYYGRDKLNTKDEDKDGSDGASGYESYMFNWGNVLVQTGISHQFADNLTAEFTGAFTRFFSGSEMHSYNRINGVIPGSVLENKSDFSSTNSINDFIARADFRHTRSDACTMRFGASATRHNFMPTRTSRRYIFNSSDVAGRDSTQRVDATEMGAYIESEWRTDNNVVVNAGLNSSLFIADSKVRGGISPRLSVMWSFAPLWALKAAATRTTQYVHLLQNSFMALPTDRWIPISGNLKPQTANKISVGVYRETQSHQYTASVEAYYKRMNNIIEYRDDYYLTPPIDMGMSQVCSGRGTSKGVDFKLEKTAGRITGHVAYSLGWTDRTFAEKNNGNTYPAQFDNRHTVNILLNWKASRKVNLNAAWTGHSGNRFTMSLQEWQVPPAYWWEGMMAGVRAPLNNCRLPFYHNLDISADFMTRRGYWTVSVFNVYCHRNAVAVKKGDRPGTFKTVNYLPVIPSVSYTWKF